MECSSIRSVVLYSAGGTASLNTLPTSQKFLHERASQQVRQLCLLKYFSCSHQTTCSMLNLTVIHMHKNIPKKLNEIKMWSKLFQALLECIYQNTSDVKRVKNRMRKMWSQHLHTEASVISE